MAKEKKEKKNKKAVAKTTESSAPRGRTSRMSKLAKRVARCEVKAPKKALPVTVVVERSIGEETHDGFITAIDEKNKVVTFRRKKTNASAKLLTENFRFCDIIELFGTPGKKPAQITVAARSVEIRTIPKAKISHGPGYTVVTDEHGDTSHFFENSNYTVRCIGDAEA